MENRKAWEAVGGVIMVDTLPREDPNNRFGCKQCVWKMITGNRELHAGKRDNIESFNRQSTTRPDTARLSPTSERPGHLRIDPLGEHNMCLQVN